MSKMLTSSGWGCVRGRHLTGVLAIGTYNSPHLRKEYAGFQQRCYSKDTCCKNTPQTQGRDVEPWPKMTKQHPPWRGECYTGPDPPNYDPYRIKVPEIVVPPLDPTGVKEPQNDTNSTTDGPPPTTGGKGGIRDLFHKSSVVHPDYWKEKVELKPAEVPDTSCAIALPRLGYHGRSKYKYAFHEPWKPLDRLTLMAEAEKEEKDANNLLKTEEENIEPPEKVDKIV